MSAFEKLSTRARELLAQEPRPSTDDISDQMLREVWDERLTRADFVLRMRPAMRSIVKTAASAMRMSMLDEASAAYLARPVNQQLLEGARQSISAPLGGARERLPERVVSGPSRRGTHEMPAAPPAPPEADQAEDANQPDIERPLVERSAPVPQADHDQADTQLARVGQRNGGGQSMLEGQDRRAAPVTPLSLRAEVLPGWRSLVNEPLFVPESNGLTYGSATREHWHRRLQWHHEQAKGHLDTARKERLILQALETTGADTLSALLGEASS